MVRHRCQRLLIPRSKQIRASTNRINPSPNTTPIRSGEIEINPNRIQFKTDPQDKTLKTKFKSRQIEYKSKTHNLHQPDPKDIKLNSTPTPTITTHPNPIMVRPDHNVSGEGLNQIRSHVSSILDEACFV